LETFVDQLKVTLRRDTGEKNGPTSCNRKGIRGRGRGIDMRIQERKDRRVEIDLRIGGKERTGRTRERTR